jgi:CRP-like cAMP-binding protein
LRQIEVFSELREEDASCLGEVQVWHAPAGSSIYRDGDLVTGFWGVVQGEVRAFKKEDGRVAGLRLHFRAGDSFGEVPLLTGRPSSVLSSEIVADATLISIGEEGFWKLLASCPVVRRAIMADMHRGCKTTRHSPFIAKN